MKNAEIRKITLKCDHCDWKKEITSINEVTVGDKCPKCNNIVVTQQDIDAMAGFMGLMDAVNELEIDNSSNLRVEGTFGTREGFKIN